MRLRVERIALVGTSREPRFQPGVNIVLGPITTGKSTLMKLLRVLLGSGVPALPPEVRDNVTALAGEMLAGDRRVSVVRPLVTATTAKVDLATDEGEALRLPALKGDRTAPTTYGRWLLANLGLPDLTVAAAPTRPEESNPTSVSINDYLRYCQLTQEEIDTSVFGSNHPQRNIKRQYVFRILYGLFDARLAAIQEELRRVEAELRIVNAGAESFRGFLEDTPWEKRAALEQQRATAEARLRELDQRDRAAAGEAQRTPQARRLREEVQRLDHALAEARSAGENERRSIAQLEELAAQLETQSSRLTKSIVAGARLYDLDFKVCPRCASPLDQQAADEGHCYLCHQQPQAALSRADLVKEQDRITAQISETDGLISTRTRTREDLERQVAQWTVERAQAGTALDQHLQEFVSDRADQIAQRARERAEAQALLARSRDYLILYQRLDEAQARAQQLEDRKQTIEAEAEQANVVETASAERIARLEEHFVALVDAFGTPRFAGEPRAAINRRTFLPILNGRSFDELSSGGLKVLTNIAYALAHHLTALDFDLPLPGVLLIDGITKNVGRDEYDQARVDAVFDKLREIGEQHGDRLQIIVAANDVPAAVADRVALTLAADDRLIPLGSEDLVDIEGEPGGQPEPSDDH